MIEAAPTVSLPQCRLHLAVHLLVSKPKHDPVSCRCLPHFLVAPTPSLLGLETKVQPTATTAEVSGLTKACTCELYVKAKLPAHSLLATSPAVRPMTTKEADPRRRSGLNQHKRIDHAPVWLTSWVEPGNESGQNLINSGSGCVVAGHPSLHSTLHWIISKLNSFFTTLIHLRVSRHSVLSPDRCWFLRIGLQRREFSILSCLQSDINCHTSASAARGLWLDRLLH